MIKEPNTDKLAHTSALLTPHNTNKLGSMVFCHDDDSMSEMTLKSYDFSRLNSIARAVVDDLVRFDWLDDGKVKILDDRAGIGKTHISVGLGRIASEMGYHCFFLTAKDITHATLIRLEDISLKEKRRNFDQILDDCCVADLLIIDGIDYGSLEPQERGLVRDILRIRREDKSSTIINGRNVFPICDESGIDPKWYFENIY